MAAITIHVTIKAATVVSILFSNAATNPFHQSFPTKPRIMHSLKGFPNALACTFSALVSLRHSLHGFAGLVGKLSSSMLQERAHQQADSMCCVPNVHT